MKPDKANFNSELLQYLASTTTPFHAVKQMGGRLQAAGFKRLYESDSWDLQSKCGYWLTRNDSSIIAFRTGDNPVEQGWRMVGAHTDSPGLKVKPNADLDGRIAVEVYGGALLAPWFDRDLSLAGRVSLKARDGKMSSCLIDFQRPLAVIPSLAIHLDRKANENRTINRQTEINLIPGSDRESISSFVQMLHEQVCKEYPQLQDFRVMDYEVFAYDTQQPAFIGNRQELLVSARLDNQLSCFIGLKAILAADANQPALLVCNDHEEVGSQSASGAQGPFLRDVLTRISAEPLSRLMSRSMMISADNAHALHPNYTDKHDSQHGPQINAGPVIKINANQRYATNSETSALFKQLCEHAEVPVQTFVTRNDMACGSTIGPITAAELGVATIDVGCPQWGMHSIRETAGSDDAWSLYRVLELFFNQEKAPVFPAQVTNS